jgi:hypothetical protein
MSLCIWGSFCWNFTQDLSYFTLLVGNPWKSLIASGQSLFQQPFRAAVHGILYIYCTVIYTVQFPAFTDADEVLMCIQDNVEGIVSIVSPDYL